MFPLSKFKEKLCRRFNSYSSRGHAYTCTWLLHCAFRTEKTFQYFLCSEPKIPTSDQHSETECSSVKGAATWREAITRRKQIRTPPHNNFLWWNCFPKTLIHGRSSSWKCSSTNRSCDQLSNTGSQLCQTLEKYKYSGGDEESHQHYCRHSLTPSHLIS